MIEWHGSLLAENARRCAGVILAATLMLTAAVTGAAAQDADLQSVVDRLDRLERDINTLSRTVYRGEKPPPSAGDAAAASSGAAAAQIGVRVNELETELRSLTGMVEKLSYEVSQVNRRLDNVVADLEFRLSNIEQGKVATAGATDEQAVASVPKAPPVKKVVPGASKAGTLGTVSESELAAVREGHPSAGASPGGASQGAAPGAPKDEAANGSQSTGADTQVASATPGALPEGTPQEQYDYARKLLIKGEFDAAEKALTTFLDEHGDDDLAGNARYWLGETHYVRGEYLKAAEVFLNGYQKEPKGTKAPDSLLKLGMSLARLEKTKEACATFAKLHEDFPDASANLQNVAAREQERIGCK
jgi:tol-pal system protein YbgF